MDLQMLTIKQAEESGVDYRIVVHSNSSQKAVGTYKIGMDKADVKKVIGDGTFGGHWEYFDRGHFSYIQYTD